MALPMPRDAPVTKATCPERSTENFMLLTSCGMTDFFQMRNSLFGALAFDFAVDALHQAAEYATRPDFIHPFDTLGKQPADGIFPEDWADDLLDEQAANFFGIVVRFGVDIGDDRN